MRHGFGVLVALFVASCESAPPEPDQRAGTVFEGATLSPRELQLRLRELVDYFVRLVEQTGRDIASGTDDVEIKKRSVGYRMRIIPVARDTLDLENPVFGATDLWTLAVQALNYVETGDGRTAFGDQQQTAIDGLKTFLRDYRASLLLDIPDEQIDRAERSVHEFAKRHPIKGRGGRVGLLPSESAEAEEGSMFAWVPSISLSPFGGVSGGIEQGASAIRGFTSVAERFTEVTEAMPERLGWQLELLTYNLESTTTVKSVAASMRMLADSIESAPDDLRGAIEATFESVDGRLTNVERTLGELKGASAELQVVAREFDKTANSITPMAEALDRALRTFRDLYILLAEEPDAPETDPSPRRPFDVLDYDQTAGSISGMAAELRSTLDRFETILADDSLDTGVSTVAEKTQQSLTSVIWSAVLGAVTVLAALFAMLFVYRRLTSGL